MPLPLDVARAEAGTIDVGLPVKSAEPGPLVNSRRSR